MTPGNIIRNFPKFQNSGWFGNISLMSLFWPDLVWKRDYDRPPVLIIFEASGGPERKLHYELRFHLKNRYRSQNRMDSSYRYAHKIIITVLHHSVILSSSQAPLWERPDNYEKETIINKIDLVLLLIQQLFKKFR